MFKIIALFGESANGKDFIKNYILQNYPSQTHRIINCTTREKREGEIQGKDYFFLSPNDFAQSMLNGEMIEATSFNNWFYGTEKKALSANKINIGVFSIQAIECLLESPELNVIPVYIYASEKTRLLRALNREKNPNCSEICRRFQTDKKDFDDINFTHFIINSENDINKEIKKIAPLFNIVDYSD